MHHREALARTYLQKSLPLVKDTVYRTPLCLRFRQACAGDMRGFASLRCAGPAGIAQSPVSRHAPQGRHAHSASICRSWYLFCNMTHALVQSNALRAPCPAVRAHAHRAVGRKKNVDPHAACDGTSTGREAGTMAFTGSRPRHPEPTKPTRTATLTSAPPPSTTRMTRPTPSEECEGHMASTHPFQTNDTC